MYRGEKDVYGLVGGGVMGVVYQVEGIVEVEVYYYGVDNQKVVVMSKNKGTSTDKRQQSSNHYQS